MKSGKCVHSFIHSLTHVNPHSEQERGQGPHPSALNTSLKALSGSPEAPDPRGKCPRSHSPVQATPKAGWGRGAVAVGHLPCVLSPAGPAPG